MSLRLVLAVAGGAGLAGGAPPRSTHRSRRTWATLGLGTNVSRAGRRHHHRRRHARRRQSVPQLHPLQPGPGETARWVRAGDGASASPMSISRVTGGEASQIDGTLDVHRAAQRRLLVHQPGRDGVRRGRAHERAGRGLFLHRRRAALRRRRRFAVAAPDGSTLSVAARGASASSAGRATSGSRASTISSPATRG